MSFLSKKTIDEYLPFIENLAELVVRNKLSEIEVKNGDLVIRISREKNKAQSAEIAKTTLTKTLQHTEEAELDVIKPAFSESVEQSGNNYDEADILKSPMVGTAYLASSPGTDNFARIGMSVAKGETMMIIEAMKTMNHIEAHKSGIVKAILIENEMPVEYHQQLAIIE